MGLCNWNVLSTPIPLEIFLTIKEEFNPAFLMPITTPSKTCNRTLSPSLTFTDTATVSPGLKSGVSSFNCLVSKFLMIWAGVFSSKDTFTDCSSSAAASSADTSSSVGASSSTDASSAGVSSLAGASS